MDAIVIPDYTSEERKNRIREKAKAVLRRNRKQGKRVIKGEEVEYLYTCPAVTKYPHQWLWDSSFHVIVTSKFEPDSAKREVKSLFECQREDDGFMPNMILWGGQSLFERLVSWLFVSGMTSNITQPPVIALSLKEIFRQTEDLEFTTTYLPKVKRFYRWLEKQRDPDGDNLVSVIHPWETGIDATPAFDRLLGIAEAKPRSWRVRVAPWRLLFKYARLGWDEEAIFASGAFNVEHVMFNCIYAQGLRAIGWLSQQIGDADDAGRYAKKANDVESAILNNCWDEEEGRFFDVSHRDHKCPEHRHLHLKVNTISSLFPIILESIDPEIVRALVKTHLLNRREFWLAFPVPSVSKKEPTFNPNDNRLLWRGPTWINTNWFLFHGLRKHGYADESREIAKRSIFLADQHGFWEFYNPDTPEGGGQEDYGWSTLVVDMLDYL